MVMPIRRLLRVFFPVLLAGFSIGSIADAQDAAPKKNTSEAAKSAGTAKPAAKHTNRLSKETSPYLLLHAHNPVDWYPWGDEALQKAKRENKPIFLSIGYSSCHWCHVMERESFLDEEIAKFLNENFVCVKVDREERPDIDTIYMNALQMYNRLSGNPRGGGWPLSMFLTPDCKPFFGGTYFPARDGDRGVTIGFLSLVKRIADFWTKQPDRIREDAETLTKFVKSDLDSRRPIALEPLSSELIDKVLEVLDEQLDPQYGGFGYIASQSNTPKFPEASNLMFLIDRMQADESDRASREKAKRALIGTLDGMARGGIRDHLGGGFHRYSVDRFWRIPHFEKMLYDNGQLATVYAEAYRLTGNEEYRRIVEEMLDFVQREMTDKGGAFYSALDAESEGEEGRFYRWEKQEIERTLAEPGRTLFARVYGLNDEPNFEERFYVPQLSRPFTDIAKDAGHAADELESQLAPLRKQLLAARNKRSRPLTDTKILTSWNGLMIRGYADAGRILQRPEYIRSAASAADFILKNVRTPEGRLMRTYSQGEARLNAYLDDYAFFVDGLIGLYRASGDKKWLTAADELTAKQIELFGDEDRGGFYFTSDDHESLIARGVDPVDGAEPSGNSVAAENLLFLSKELNKPEYRQKAERTIQSVAGLMKSSPAASPRMAVALAELLRTAEKK